MPSRRLRLFAICGAVITVLIGTAFAYSLNSSFFGQEHGRNGVMLILRGIANERFPRGQLDDRAALEYARRVGYRGEVLDVAGNTGANSEQVSLALARIRDDKQIAAIYGFSGGGYNVRAIWTQLTDEEKERIRKVVIIGSPGVGEADFPDVQEVIIKKDPPAGHLAGPKALLDELDRS